MRNWLHKFIPETPANHRRQESCSSPSFTPCLYTLFFLFHTRKKKWVIFPSFLALAKGNLFFAFYTEAFFGWGGLGGGARQQQQPISESAAEPHTCSLCHLCLNKRLGDELMSPQVEQRELNCRTKRNDTDECWCKNQKVEHEWSCFRPWNCFRLACSFPFFLCYYIRSFIGPIMSSQWFTSCSSLTTQVVERIQWFHFFWSLRRNFSLTHLTSLTLSCVSPCVRPAFLSTLVDANQRRLQEKLSFPKNAPKTSGQICFLFGLNMQ